MNRRPLPVAAALAATAALLLTACGSGDDSSKDNDKIAGADTDGPSQSASSSAGPPSDAERPKIVLAKDMKNTFDGGKTGDPVKDTILYDNTQAIAAMDEAIDSRSLQKESFGTYLTGEAAKAAAVWVQGFYDDGITWTGEVRYYKRSVTSLEKNVATLTYCSDESKSFNKDIKTKKTEQYQTLMNMWSSTALD